MEKLVIFGGFGFVGKNLLEELSDCYDITVISRNSNKDIMTKYTKLNHVKFDINTDQNLDKIMHKLQPDFIINLVSIVTADRNLNLFKYMLESNLNALIKIFYATKELDTLKMILQFGSGEEYGNIERPFKETQREFPNSPYALAKQLTTNTAMMLYCNFNYPITVIRPSNIFGKYQDDTKFIPYIINRLLDNEPISTTFCEQKRDFIYVNNLSKCVKGILNQYDTCVGQIINVSSGKSIALKDIILFCKEKCNSTSRINFGEIPYRENEIMDFVLDNSKLRNLIKGSLDSDIYKELTEYIRYLKG